MGKKVELVWRDSKSNADVSKANVTELIDQHHVKMVFGGSSSAVASRRATSASRKAFRSLDPDLLEHHHRRNPAHRQRFPRVQRFLDGGQGAGGLPE